MTMLLVVVESRAAVARWSGVVWVGEWDAGPEWTVSLPGTVWGPWLPTCHIIICPHTRPALSPPPPPPTYLRRPPLTLPGHPPPLAQSAPSPHPEAEQHPPLSPTCRVRTSHSLRETDSHPLRSSLRHPTTPPQSVQSRPPHNHILPASPPLSLLPEPRRSLLSPPAPTRRLAGSMPPSSARAPRSSVRRTATAPTPPTQEGHIGDRVAAGETAARALPPAHSGESALAGGDGGGWGRVRRRFRRMTSSDPVPRVSHPPPPLRAPRRTPLDQ
jgi:hypothetical protein